MRTSFLVFLLLRLPAGIGHLGGIVSGLALGPVLGRFLDEQCVDHRQDEERGRLAGQQSAQDRPGQRGVGFAASFDGQGPGNHGEECRQGRHRDRPDAQLAALRIASNGVSPSCRRSSWA